MLQLSERRVAVCYFMLVTAMFLIIMRIVNIALDPEFQTAATANSVHTVKVSRQRGTIFDCNMKPITNATKKYTSLITDIPAASVALTDIFSESEAADILGEIRSGSLPLITSDRDISGNGIVSFVSYEHEQRIANHLIGYLDESGHGVSGLEAVFDEILYSESSFTLSFGIDGHGNLISGDSIRYEYDRSVEQNGIMITLDADIQAVAEKAADGLNTGAVVVSEIESGEIRAMVSRPDFSLSDLSAALGNQDLPLINRAMMTYNVGSGFKPCVAAAALEAGHTNYLWFCEGSSDIDGQMFRCHKMSGHKWLDLAGALKHSCNSFFYNLAIDVGAEKVYEMAERAGFNNAVSFGYGLSTRSSQIGDINRLSISERALANLAIGQGELMVSPVGILNLYSAIASDGSYYPPSLIKGVVQNGGLSEETAENEKVFLMSKSTAKELRKCLLGVLDENGTGYIAKPKTVSAAGKTSTAETGIVKDGKAVTNTWFCGFFPFEDPKYAVAVIAENSEEGCGGVFAEIADGITALKKPILKHYTPPKEK